MHSATIRKLYRNGGIIGTTVWMMDGQNNFRITFDSVGAIANPDVLEGIAMTSLVRQVNNIDPDVWAKFAHKVQYGTLRIGEVREIELSGQSPVGP